MVVRLWCIAAMAVVTLVVIGLEAAAQAPPPMQGRFVPRKKAPPTPTTFEDRNAWHPANQKCMAESLALPLITALGTTPVTRASADSFPLPDHPQDGHLFVWRVVPWVPAHGEFMKRYAAVRDSKVAPGALDKEKLSLVDWCEKEQLPDCTEFVLRDILVTRAKGDSPAYGTALGRWKALVAKRQSPFTFDVPMTGEWHSLADPGKKNERKATSCFAVDLARQKTGLLFAGGNANPKHFAWDQEVTSICDGLVLAAEDQTQDKPAGQPGPSSGGNRVLVDAGGGILIEYANLRSKSVAVKKDDRVAAGQKLGHVGNSGGGIPSLHLTVVDRDGLSMSGRYKYSLQNTKGWTDMEGIDLEKGWNFRSLDKASQ